LFEYIKRVVHLHAGLEPLRRGALKDLYVAEQQYAYARTTPRASAVVVINNDSKPAAFEFSVAEASLKDGARLEDRLETLRGETRVAGGHVSVTMPARSASILVERER